MLVKTSQWEWQYINRRTEYSFLDNSFEIKRQSWDLARFRWSNDAYSSEVGTESSSLSAYNAGVTETVTPPTYDLLTVSNSLINFELDNGDTFSMQQYLRNGQPAYICSREIDGYTLVLFSEDYSSNYWHVGGTTYAEASAGTFKTAAGFTVANQRYFKGGTDAGDPEGSYEDIDQSVLNTGTFTFTANTKNFRCVSDNQIYPQNGVDWYQQQQVWHVVTPWEAA